jgi:hypothetical protein
MTPTRNGIAACSPQYKYGTIFAIPALKRWFVCEDRGSLIMSGFLDLWVESNADAWEFGRREMVVIVIQPDRVRYGLKSMLRRYGKHNKKKDAG